MHVCALHLRHLLTCIRRFSSDLGQVDELLPPFAFNTLQLLAMCLGTIIFGEQRLWDRTPAPIYLFVHASVCAYVSVTAVPRISQRCNALHIRLHPTTAACVAVPWITIMVPPLFYLLYRIRTRAVRPLRDLKRLDGTR